ncbi:MAG TPA: site-specific integrase, partial [Gaiellaceae bacterium]|nr:site-specific integrase [Gaiellaceae bacterium]
MHDPLAHVWEEQLNAFDAYLARKRRAKNTRIKYRQQLLALARWAGERTPASLTTQTLQFDYLEQWAAEFERRHARPPTARSERNAITAIKSFYNFLYVRGWLVDEAGREIANPAGRIETPAIPRRRNDWLRDREDEAVLAACATPIERILTALLRWEGLRVGEAAELHQGDLDLTPGE